MQTKLVSLQSQEPATSMPLYNIPHRLTARELKDHYLVGYPQRRIPYTRQYPYIWRPTEDMPCAC